MTNDETTPGWRLAEAEADHTVWLPGDVPMFFRLMKAGSFLMGSRGAKADEEPRHRVQIEDDYFMSTFPVTQAQWLALMGTTPEQMKQRRDNGEGNTWGEITGVGHLHPMPFVNWHDAHEFITAFNQLHPANEAMLPSEAHWEYACRAGTITEYHSGDGEAALRTAGWFDGNSNGFIQPVGLHARNDFGLYEMHGSVWEWCTDAWDDQAYAKRPDGWKAPLRPELVKGDPSRVVRGGASVDSARLCRAACRIGGKQHYRSGRRGFRLVLSLGPALPGSVATEQARAKPATGGGGGGTKPEMEGAGAEDFSPLKLPRRPA